MPTIATLSEMTAPIPMTTSQIAPVFKRLVVAYDLSSYADTAFDYTMDLATKHDSEIILVHMQKPCVDPTAGSDGAAARMATSDLGKILEQKADLSRRLGIETRWLLQTGMPVDVLAQVVADLKPDILFLGAYENDRLDRKHSARQWTTCSGHYPVRLSPSVQMRSNRRLIQVRPNE